MAKKLDYEFIVIGAGPYGLAVASHLRSAGISVRIFGKPMDFWRTQMPKGMLLRSPWGGSNISDAKKAWTLDSFETARGSTLNRRLPVEDFVAYGAWFQQQALPEIDQRNARAFDRMPQERAARCETERKQIKHHALGCARISANC